MKKILATGTGALLLIGVVLLLFKLVFLDFLFPVFRPLVLLIIGDGKEFLVVLLSLLFLAAMILLLGFVLTRERAKKIVTKILKKVPDKIESSRGALVKKTDGTYFIAAVIKKIELIRWWGNGESFYVLYCPSSPIPWGGLPIVFAKERNVILLKLSFREIYMIAASFGQSTPESISELKNQSTDF